MGQTQILFIILSVIIVGAVIAIGIPHFGQNPAEANKTALILDANNIGARAQQWYQKPANMGGGGGSFNGLDFAQLSLGSDANTYMNDNGSFEMSVTGQEVTLTAHPRDATIGDLTFTITPNSVQPR